MHVADALSFTVAGLLSFSFSLSLCACGARTGLSSPEALRADDAGDACGETAKSRACKSECGSGTETCVDGVWGPCSAPQPRQPGPEIVLHGTVRDFHSTHPDFEKEIADDPGIVEVVLGDDRKPVYAGGAGTRTTHGRTVFDQWFRDVPGVNLSAPLDLVLRRSGGLIYGVDDPAFFPIDGRLFGDEGREHNFHFTLELHAELTYRGGESFTYAGDDDLWAFIANRRVIDLGGVHSTESRTVNLDALAPSLGLSRGGRYPIDLFYAERHTSGSTLRIETSIVSFDPCR